MYLRKRQRLLVAHRALGQLRLGVPVTVLAEGMGGILEGVQSLRHTRLGIETGLAFYNPEQQNASKAP